MVEEIAKTAQKDCVLVVKSIVPIATKHTSRIGDKWIGYNKLDSFFKVI